MPDQRNLYVRPDIAPRESRSAHLLALAAACTLAGEFSPTLTTSVEFPRRRPIDVKPCVTIHLDSRSCCGAAALNEDGGPP